jgi:pimeloyl-ACP methyl ester carboxylesterase
VRREAAQEPRVITTQVLELHARDARIAAHLSGEGPLAVLVHGFPLDHRMWSAVLRGELSRARRLCAVDLRGHGQSPWCGDPAHTMELMAADVADVIEALGGGPADVCGLSMGGYVALALAEARPELVRSLVLSNTRPTADSAAQRMGRLASIESAARDGRPAVAAAMLEKLLPQTADPLHVAQVRTMIEATPLESIVADQRGMLQREDRSEQLRASATPTLVVAGDQDALTPLSETLAWNEELLGGDVEVIAGTGHMSPLEDAAAWSRAVARFWR